MSGLEQGSREGHWVNLAVVSRVRLHCERLERPER
jgi:hypothetical protein